ncbi:hydroxypyruvate isomerase [Pacificibacter maritimus]|uniref:Hydroxypyruvate isomerase n=1 Tax=Pacificibacter maritimus TaxID=762213 RepID=A0A3N4U8W7_9RHOB|nr:TIM barrel protein [Pacificibacter maritimus]RPE67186.1 hydroxypyruvate isomerase [Pacificibacter maritimus]
MPKFAANLSYLFKEYPFIERFAEAKASGFDAVEVLFPYDEAASEIARKLADHRLDMVLINMPPPNWAGGERGFAAMPATEDRFRKDFIRSIRFAKLLRAQHMHLMAGRAKGVVALETYKRNLAWAAKEAPEMSLVIEPLNETDMPGYFLNNFDMALEILDDISAPNLGLQFDAYHAQMITGDLFETWDKCKDYIRHVQIASAPERAEPRKGEIDYPAFFKHIDYSGYTGWVSAEYTPKKRTTEGLDWMQMPT